MANTKDLRFIKTERLIEETYLKLKKETRSPIKVNELCKAALINKTTFYTHYETMETLHQHMCNSQIDKILNECPYIKEAFTDTANFVKSIVDTLFQNQEMIVALFQDNKSNLTTTVESNLLERYLSSNKNPKMEMTIIFAIGGAARLLVTNQSPDYIDETIQLIEKVIQSNL